LERIPVSFNDIRAQHIPKYRLFKLKPANDAVRQRSTFAKLPFAVFVKMEKISI